MDFFKKQETYYFVILKTSENFKYKKRDKDSSVQIFYVSSGYIIWVSKKDQVQQASFAEVELLIQSIYHF